MNILYALLLLMFYYATSSLRRNVEVETLLYSDIVEYFRNEQVEEFVVNNKNVISLKLNDEAGTELSFQLPSLELFLSSVPTEEILRQYDAGILKSYDFAPPYTMPFWLSILPYLWRNAEPCQMMMGDAGSRAFGLFIGIAILKTGNMLLYFPLCAVLFLDGFLGIVKVSLARFLKIRIMKNIRTPLHDHFRKNKGWSNGQTVMRFAIVQTVISLVLLLLPR